MKLISLTSFNICYNCIRYLPLRFCKFLSSKKSLKEMKKKTKDIVLVNDKNYRNYRFPALINDF